jgi:hypothetical protein
LRGVAGSARSKGHKLAVKKLLTESNHLFHGPGFVHSGKRKWQKSNILQIETVVKK